VGCAAHAAGRRRLLSCRCEGGCCLRAFPSAPPTLCFAARSFKLSCVRASAGVNRPFGVVRVQSASRAQASVHWTRCCQLVTLCSCRSTNTLSRRTTAARNRRAGPRASRRAAYDEVKERHCLEVGYITYLSTADRGCQRCDWMRCRVHELQQHIFL